LWHELPSTNTVILLTTSVLQSTAHIKGGEPIICVSNMARPNSNSIQRNITYIEYEVNAIDLAKTQYHKLVLSVFY